MVIAHVTFAHISLARTWSHGQAWVMQVGKCSLYSRKPHTQLKSGFLALQEKLGEGLLGITGNLCHSICKAFVFL